MFREFHNGYFLGQETSRDYTEVFGRSGGTQQPLERKVAVADFWSHCGCESFKQRIVILRPGDYFRFARDRPAQSESFKKRLKIRHILEQSLFFKTPYVWNDRRPRPRLKERSSCRAIGHVHERCLDPASDVMVTAVLPV